MNELVHIMRDVRYVNSSTDTVKLLWFIMNNDFSSIIDPGLETIIYAIIKNNKNYKHIREDDKLNLIIVSRNGLWLKYVTNQTYNLCLVAVSNNGLALQYVHEDFITKELLLVALSNNGEAIKFVEKHTKLLSLLSVCTSNNAIKYLKNKTPAINIISVVENYDNLLKISDLEYTNELLYIIANYSTKILNGAKIPERNLLELLPLNYSVIRFFENQSEEMVDSAFKASHKALKYIKKPEYEHILCAIKENPSIIQHVKNCKYDLTDIYEYIIEKNIENVSYIHNPSDDICIRVLRQNGLLLKNIKNRKITYNLLQTAIEQNGYVIAIIKNPTLELCMISINNPNFFTGKVHIKIGDPLRFSYITNEETRLKCFSLFCQQL